MAHQPIGIDVLDQVLLDEPGMSFPDPTDVAITPDGRRLYVGSYLNRRKGGRAKQPQEGSLVEIELDHQRDPLDRIIDRGRSRQL